MKAKACLFSLVVLLVIAFPLASFGATAGIRGTVAGGTGAILEGSGFTGSTSVVPGIPGCVKYTVTFHTPFASPPTVTLAIHGFWPSQPAQVIGIDDGAGGITDSGFSVYIVDPHTETCGSQNWDFIAVGPSR